MSRKDVAKTGSSTIRWTNRLGMAAGAIAVVAACIVLRNLRGPQIADAKDPPPAKNTANNSGVRQASATVGMPQKPQVVAVVNNEEIGRQDLARECLTHYGKEVLEAMVNKYLISQYCQQANITVTKQEVNEEVERMARKFNLSVDQWLKMLQQERNITPEQYASDVIWPTLALKKLAAEQLKPTKKELTEVFESQFGEAVKARIIVLHDPQLAKRVLAEAQAHPDQFEALARKYSVDSSASGAGLIPPIRRHMGDPKLEAAVFQLQRGDVSEIVTVGDQYVIVKCDELLPASKVTFDQVRDRLVDVVRERKLRSAAADTFKALHESAKLVNVFNDPIKGQQMPGVAAIVNDRSITIRELSEECIDRHGSEVLDGAINRKLLEQAVKSKHLTISQDELDAEVARAAIAMGKVDKNKQPDIPAWIKLVTEEQGISLETYYHDAVWPSVALKKYVGKVEVAKEDLDRGFEANYGPRVQCRAIVLKNQRKAQEVWELARQSIEAIEQNRKNADPKFFAKLADQYSMDPSKSVGGWVPPIQKWGGAPIMEKEAFSLKPGELSSILQVNDTFVILFCEGYTTPQKVEMADVKDLLVEDIHEKKMRLTMSEAFNKLKETAAIDNYIAGTVQTPKGTVGGQFGHGTVKGEGYTADRKSTDVSAAPPRAASPPASLRQ